MTRIELAGLLPKLGLVTQGELLDVANSLPEGKRDKVEDLLTQLVRLRKLTKFQAQTIYNGNGNSLVFGTYVIQDKLGTGGFGVVFRGKHRLMDRPVAIKVMDQSKLNTRDVVDRFIREIRAVARLEHPNIVKAYDADQAHGLYYLAMELVNGKILHDVMKEKGRLPVADVVDYIRQAAEGLDYAHQQGVVHRDIKPGNLILDASGRIKILDMGLARLNAPKDASGDQVTEAGTSLGTSDFMSPEQSIDSYKADARSDIYSLGCTLYFLLVGDVMFPNRSDVKRIVDHHVSPAPSLRLSRTDVSPDLDQIFQAMVAKNPEERYQTMAEVINELDRLSEEDDLAEQQADAEAFLRAVVPGHKSSMMKSKSSGPRSMGPRSTPKSSNSFIARQTHSGIISPRSSVTRSRRLSHYSPHVVATVEESIPDANPWYEPLMRPENRNFIVGGITGLLFAIIAGSLFINGSTNTADAKVASNVPAGGSAALTSAVAAVPTTVNVNPVPTAPIAMVPAWTAPQVATYAAPASSLPAPAIAPNSNPATTAVTVVVPAFAAPASPNHSLVFQFNFEPATNATTTHGSGFPTKVEGNRLYSHIMYYMNPDRKAPIRLKMREAGDVKGADGRPGVLQLIGEAVPQGHELALFKLCGEKDQPYFHLPHWKPGAVTMGHLRQTVVQLSYRIVRANPNDDSSLAVSFSLEQNHSSSYNARLELDHVQTSGEWQTLMQRLSDGGNVERFLAAMAENPDAGLQLVISSYNQPFRTGDRIEISDIRFFHEENATAVSSTR